MHSLPGDRGAVTKYEPDKAKPQLAYTRKTGWVVVVWRGEGYAASWFMRRSMGAGSRGARLWRPDILAFAPLPPIPETAL